MTVDPVKPVFIVILRQTRQVNMVIADNQAGISHKKIYNTEKIGHYRAAKEETDQIHQVVKLAQENFSQPHIVGEMPM